ncbi:divergent PAP2 family-domain-containing protein [Dunaliella salina]|uniref:Divergent PAP2 family-domain-containing protein n=1 Tax=Dunaliella salina TaxID=3046 RepID=A0ABQ7H078_DUNSA|nr:divergent PAP2 family-domain-containing protein [Dunaliella salina]|eukprot:KAF5840259.1 divergent PAP2 family-domain-containing protein [Dunaliella salina]
MLSLQSYAQSSCSSCPLRARSNSVSSRTRHLTVRSSNCDAASISGQQQCGTASFHAFHQSPAAECLPASMPELQQPEIQASTSSAAALSASKSPIRKAMRRFLRTMHSTKWRDHVDIMGPAAMGFVCPVLPGGGFQDLLANRVLVTGFIAWFAAQFGKIFTWRFKKGTWDLKAIVQPGGMPSSHSSLCSGVTTALALQEGLSSPLFAISMAFSVIVMYDAMGVRQHAGKQAAVLNQVVTEIFQKNPAIGDIKLKEVLGHTPRQVLCGAVLGFVVAMCLPWGTVPQQ